MNVVGTRESLALYSDWAYTSAVAGLTLALLLLSATFAIARTRTLEKSTAPGVVARDSASPGVVVEMPRRSRTERLERAGIAVVFVSAVLLLMCIVLRGLATSRAPWGNMYEFINLTCFCGLVAAAVVLRRPQYRSLWVFVLVPVLILLTVSGKWLYSHAAPVMPALQSYWLPIHVSVVSLGSGVFLVAGVASILFLVKMSRLGQPGRTDLAGRIVSKLPDAQTLDRIAYRTTIFAFPVFGFGVIFGAIWAEEAWGRYWGWDPKENGALIIVLWNVLILHARLGGLVQARGLAVLVLGGNIVTAWSWFGVNQLSVGLHSYGFTDSASFWLMVFVLSQIAICAAGLVPPRRWKSGCNT